MIPVEYYTNVYFLFISVVVLLSLLPTFFKNKLQDFPKSNLVVGSFFIICISICFIGLRDPYGSWKYLGDTSNYSLAFESINTSAFEFKNDFGFYAFMLFSRKYLNLELFYFLCAAIYVIPVFISFKKWFKQYAYFALALFVTSMSFWGFGINGLRNGLATSIFIFALGFQNNKVLKYSLMILSISFHNSMILPFIAYLISNYLNNTKLLIKIWVFSVIISYFFGSQLELFFENLLLSYSFSNDKRMEGYFAESIDGELVAKGYRFDFILYSAIALFFGYYYKYKLHFKSYLYDKLLNTYIIANTVWVLLIFLAYTNRTAYLSWFLLPIVLIFPLLKGTFKFNQIKVIGLLILGSLLFTLIMQFK